MKKMIKSTAQRTKHQKHHTGRRILALLLVLAVALQSLSGTDVAAEKESIKQTVQPEEAVLEKYGIFASDRNLQLYCNEASLAADLYTGKDFICSGSRINIEGEADAVGNVYPWCGQFAASGVNQGHKKESLPDIRTRIEKKTGHWEEQQNYMNVNGEEICNGYKKSASGIQISGTNFRGNCYLMAEETIQYSVDSLNRDGGRVVLYSENGDICISGSDIVVNGILAAPNGNVRINANRVTVNGRIYARGVEMSGTCFNLKASEKDMELLEEEDTEEKKNIIKIYDSEEEYREGTTKEVEIGGGKLKLSEKETPVQKVTKKYNEKAADGVTAEVTLAEDRTPGGRGKLDYQITFDGNSSEENQIPGEPDASFARYNGNLYALVNKNVLWKEAELLCQIYGGHLVTITGREENEVAAQLVKEQDSYYNAIGFTDEEEEGNWRWVTGEKASYLNWNPGEPNNSFGNGQDYGYMYSWGKWDDGYSTKRAPFLCEWEGKEKLVPEEGRHIKLVVEVQGKVEAGEGWTCTIHEDGSTTAVYEAGTLGEIRSCPLSLSLTPEKAEGYQKVIKDSYYTYYDVYGNGHRVPMGDLWLPTDGVAEEGTWSAVYDSGETGTRWGRVCWEAGQAGDSAVTARVKAYDTEEEESIWEEIENGGTLKGVRGRYIEISVILKRSRDFRSPWVDWVMVAGEEADPYEVPDTTAESKILCNDTVFENSSMSAYCQVTGGLHAGSRQTRWSLWKDGIKLGEEAWEIQETRPFFATFRIPAPGDYQLQAVTEYKGRSITARKKIQVRRLPRIRPIEPLAEPEEINMVIDLPAYAKPGSTVEGRVLFPHGESLESIKIYEGEKEAARSETKEISVTLPEKTGEILLEIEACLKDGRVVNQQTSIRLDGKAPEIQITPGKESYEPGERGVFLLEIQDDGAVQEVRTHFDHTEIFYQHNNQVEIPSLGEGEHILEVTATDGAGNTATEEYRFTVSPLQTPEPEETKEPEVTPEPEKTKEPEKPAGNPPVAAFDSPKGEAILTEPVDITGSAYDAEEMDYYTLEYRICGAEDFILLEQSTEPKNHQPLGHLDTTMLPNGHYEIRLSVVDKEGNRNRATRKYVVEGSLKTGAMNLGFTDITAAMGGAKVNVNRTYSSANKNKGDFGIGWSLGMQGMTLSETTPLHTGYKLSVTGTWSAPGYSLNETKSHDIIIAYGDGTSDRFELTMTPDRQQLVPIHEVELGYRCVTDPGVKLEIDGKNLAVIQDTEMLLPDTSMYQQVKYKLTTREGTAIYLSAATGVTKMEDRHGNTIRVDRDGCHSEDGRSITFTRDSEDRIICAEDPAGKQTRYAYDEAGNLAEVTDQAGRTVTFHYDREHNLTGITDPSGAAVARNEYDKDGRLTAVIDAEGNRTEYGYDIQGKTQVVKDRLGNSTVYVYDGRGNILQQTDANGNTTKNTYDGSGNLLAKTDAGGNTTKYAYDGSGNITSVTDAEGNILKNTYSGRNLITAMKCGDDGILIDYDEAGNIEEATDPAGNKTSYEHDENGCVTSIADAIGTLASAQYDGDGNVIQNTDSAGIKTTYTYDEEGNRLTQTRHVETERGTEERTTRYVYDEAGDLVQTVDPEGNATAIERNLLGQMTASTDARGRRTTYEYNRQGEVSRVTYADGTTETFAYDPEGRVTESVNRLGQKQAYTYDRVGNLIKSTDSRGNSTTYAYDRNYNVTSVTNAAGAQTVYTYDALNRNTSITDAEGNTTKFTYNRYSFLTGVTDAKGNTTTYEYNKAGNRVKTIYPDGSSVESGYDGRGRTLWQKDAAGTKTEYTYDGADRLVRVENPASGKASYTYDKAGNLCAVEDANGNVTSYEYDGAGRLTKTTQADGSTATRDYDQYGRLERSTDYNGVTTTVEYDSQDRVVKEKTGACTRTHAYDACGRLAESSSGGSTVRYAYNKYGELSEKTYENGQKIRYGYDRYGRKESVTVKAGDRVLDRTTYAYDAMDRITRVVAEDGTATVYAYDENGNRKAATFASGVRITYEYDELNRLLVQKTIDSTGALIAQYQYTTGKNGERTKIQEEGLPGKTETEYEYDGAGRLTGERTVSVDGTGKETETCYTYEYDNAGNRTRKKTTAAGTTVATDYTYNSRNQLAEEENGGHKTLYTYDANGNLLKKSGAAGKESYGYDVYNRLVSCQSDRGGKKETYSYDAEGVRRSKTASDGKEEKETVFISDTSGELSRTLAETDGKGELLASYGWGDTPVSQTREGKTSTYLYDGRGNVRGLLDEEGSLTDTYAYNAYGELTAKTGETENHFLYTGEYYDGISGLYYLRARYMDPETGTFTSMDTWQGNLYEPVTLHKYLYANANPVKYQDPSGMFSLPECNIASAIGAELYQNKNVVLGMSVLNGIGKSVMTGLCGGDAGDMTEAFLEGMIEGAAMGMLFCAVAAVLATSMLTVMMAHTAASSVVSIVLAIYSVSEGDYLNALVYGAVAVAGIIGVCRWYKVTYQIDYVGEKGIARFAGGSDEETINLYRVMSKEEYDSLMSNKKFVPYDRAMEEKWFATTQGDAIKWANIFYPDGDYRMIEVTINTNYLNEMYYNQHLDNIGPAYCSSLEILEKAIKSIRGVK